MTAAVLGAVEQRQSTLVLLPFFSRYFEETECNKFVVLCMLVLAGRLSAVVTYRRALNCFAVLQQAVRLQHIANEVNSVRLHNIEVYKALTSLRKYVLHALSKFGRVLAYVFEQHEVSFELVVLAKLYVLLLAPLTDGGVFVLKLLYYVLHAAAVKLYVS
jgi:hypothetical protein